LTGALCTGARRLESSARALFSISSIRCPNTFVEQIDLLVAVAAGAVKKERGDALQRLDALLARAALDDLFQFRDQRVSGNPFQDISNQRSGISIRPFSGTYLITDY